MSENENDIASRTSLRLRLLVIGSVLTLPILLFVFRLYYLQVLQEREYTERVGRQAVRSVQVNSVRGQIQCRDGRLLATNSARYDLTLHPSEMRVERGYLWTSTYMLNTATWLEENIFHRPGNLDIVSLRRQMKRDMAHPIVLYRDLSPEEMARVSEVLPVISGVEITPRIEREYPMGRVAAHIVGYCGWQWRDVSVKDRVFRQKELLGNAGLEKQYNALLGGHAGRELVLMDPVGFVRKVLPGSSAPLDGFHLRLTLDMDAQVAAERALEGKRGALVCVDPRNGKVVAMASSPGYDLSQLSAEAYGELAKDEENRPLFHRALNGSYMPGSIVKPLVALAALENGVIDATTEFDCPGYFPIGKFRIHCAHRSGHGMLDFDQAIAVSCNPFFIQTGLLCKLPLLTAYYEAAGFGKKCGFDMIEGTSGICPSPETAQRYQKRGWTVTDTAYASIGQGMVEVTPLQAACYCGALANDGYLWRPYLVERVLRQDGVCVRQVMPELRSRIPGTAEHFAMVRQAMVNAVETPGASAFAMRKAPVPLAAKTGTAEVGSGPQKKKNTWIICYGPLPDPFFAVACVVEEGVSGAQTTAPVVINFLRGWLE